MDEAEVLTTDFSLPEAEVEKAEGIEEMIVSASTKWYETESSPTSRSPPRVW